MVSLTLFIVHGVIQLRAIVFSAMSNCTAITHESRHELNLLVWIEVQSSIGNRFQLSEPAGKHLLNSENVRATGNRILTSCSLHFSFLLMNPHKNRHVFPMCTRDLQICGVGHDTLAEPGLRRERDLGPTQCVGRRWGPQTNFAANLLLV